MKHIFYFLAIFLCVCSFSQVQVTVDTSVKKQIITGLGTCTGTSDYKDHLNELGSSAIRMSTSLGENGLEMSQNDNADPNDLDISKFTWSVGAMNVVAEAKSKNAKVIVNSFSPPAWMKTNNNLNNGGYLIDSMYEEFGEWALGCVKSFKLQSGYDMYAFGPQNEPEFPEPYSSCIFTADQLMKASRWIGRKFDSAGLSTKIFHGEILFTQGNALKYFQAVNNDLICKNYVDAFAIHISDNDAPNITGSGVTSNWYKLCYNESQRVEPIKEFWLTEDSYTGSDPGIDDAILEACCFYNGMYYGNLNMWLYCGNNTRNAKQVYYLYKQLIRFIRPGSVRLHTVTNDNSVYSLAFKNDTSKSYVIVLINKATTGKTATISFPGASGSFDIFRTSANEYCEYGGTTNLTNLLLPPRSISTLVSVYGNKLPVIDNIDTVVVLKNTSGNIHLTGISDGGDGGQTLSISAFSTMPYFNSLTVSYTSPNTTGDINYSCKSEITGSTLIGVTIDDHSNVLNGFYSQNYMFINFIIIPFINKAPTMDSIDDQNYPSSKFNIEQILSLTNVSDGNGNVQKLTLSAVSSNPDVVSVLTQGSAILKLTPKKDGTAVITVTLQDNGDTYLGGQNTIMRTFTVVCGTGIDAVKDHDMTVSVYPNPFCNAITIDTDINEFQYELENVSGIKYIERNSAGNHCVINTNMLPEGFYLLRIKGEKGISIFKLMKE